MSMDIYMSATVLANGEPRLATHQLKPEVTGRFIEQRQQYLAITILRDSSGYHEDQRMGIFARWTESGGRKQGLG